MRRAAALLLVALAAGCGSEPTQAPVAPSSAALTVEEALAHEGAEPVLVRGLLLVDAAGPRLCSALAESHPPQCGRPSLLVDGLPDGDRAGLAQAEGVAWSEREVTLRGTVEPAEPDADVRADAVLRVGLAW